MSNRCTHLLGSHHNVRLFDWSNDAINRSKLIIDAAAKCVAEGNIDRAATDSKLAS